MALSNESYNFQASAEEDEPEGIFRGVSRLWSSVNHVALVVSDIGRSLAFYTDVIGMKQIIRPDFDR